MHGIWRFGDGERCQCGRYSSELRAHIYGRRDGRRIGQCASPLPGLFGYGGNGTAPFPLGVVQNADGSLFGVNWIGGPAGGGTIYKLTQ